LQEENMQRLKLRRHSYDELLNINLDYALPCAVTLDAYTTLQTTIQRGCKLKTLLDALRAKDDAHGREREPAA
jgi:hypothetical protein